MLQVKKEPPAPGGFHDQVREFRRTLLQETLRKSGGNQTRAAELLGLSRPYLVRLMNQLDVRGHKADQDPS